MALPGSLQGSLNTWIVTTTPGAGKETGFPFKSEGCPDHSSRTHTPRSPHRPMSPRPAGPRPPHRTPTCPPHGHVPPPNPLPALPCSPLHAHVPSTRPWPSPAAGRSGSSRPSLGTTVIQRPARTARQFEGQAPHLPAGPRLWASLVSQLLPCQLTPLPQPSLSLCPRCSS